MKNWRGLLSVTAFIFVFPLGNLKAQDPITVIIKEGIKKVIVAVDLKVQRLQNRVIWLQNTQKMVENTVSKLRLNEIGDWVEKQRNLYKDYFEELWKVKDLVSYYRKVSDVTSRQILLVKEYKRTWQSVQKDGHFTPDEIAYIGKVYSGIVEESLKNLQQVILVIQSFSLQISDAKRIELINKAANDMQKNYNDLKAFNRQNFQLSLQRANDQQDVAAIKRLYGIE